MENCVPWLHTIDEDDVAEVAQRMMQRQLKSMEERTTHIVIPILYVDSKKVGKTFLHRPPSVAKI